MNSYRVRLTAKNEGVEYRDPHGVYRFNVVRNDNIWTLLLPCTKGDNYALHAMTDEEYERIVPRITSYLQKVKWFGLFPKTYTVEVKRKP